MPKKQVLSVSPARGVTKVMLQAMAASHEGQLW